MNNKKYYKSNEVTENGWYAAIDSHDKVESICESDERGDLTFGGNDCIFTLEEIIKEGKVKYFIGPIDIYSLIEEKILK
jgi:hypothetical protein